MAGERQVYRDERGNTFKATAEYAELRGWTLAEPEQAPKFEPQWIPAAMTEPEAQHRARGQASNKARTVRQRPVAVAEQLEAAPVEPTTEALTNDDREAITASAGELQPEQDANK